MLYDLPFQLEMQVSLLEMHGGQKSCSLHVITKHFFGKHTK